MKKSAFLIAMGLCAGMVSAQDLTSKKGEPILPEAGDWAIGFDATSFFNYFGTMFKSDTAKNGPNSPSAQWVNPASMLITGKYFKDEKTAYRASIRFGFASNKRVGEIPDVTAAAPTYPNVIGMKEDDMKARYHDVGVGFGIEKRKGKTRLQGYYGAEAWIWNSGQSDAFDYGNTLTPTTTPTGVVANVNTTKFTANSALTGINSSWTSNIVTDTYGNTARLTAANLGMTWGIGVRAFIGAEYFIFPKISIGAEYGYGLGFSYTSNATYSTQSLGGAPLSEGNQTITVRRSHNIALDNDINGGSGSGTGSLKLTLHF